MKSSGLCPTLDRVLFFDMDPAAARPHGFAGRTPPCSPVRPPPPLMSSERFLSGYGQEEPCVFRGPAEKRAQDHGDPERSAGSLIGAIGITPNAGILLNASSFYGDLVSDSCKNEVVKKEDRGGEKQVRSSSWSSTNGDATAAYVVKGQWTAEEDSQLVRLVKQHGVRKWSYISRNMFGRIGKQCRERWHNHLRPDIKKAMWTEEEERQLIEAHMKFGNRWAEIARHMSGRSENSIKNHWNATKRKMNAKTSRRGNPDNGGRCPPSVLQEYIQSKNTLDFNKTCSTKTTPSSTSTQDSTGSMEERLLHTRSAGGLQRGETHGSFMHGSALNRLAFDACHCMPTPCIGGGCYQPTAHSCSNKFSESSRSTHLHSRNYASASTTDVIGMDNTWELLKARASSTSRNRDLDLVEMLSLQFSSSSQSSSSHSALHVANSKCF
ncbi:unnamed protein product [Musa banksii]